MLFSGRSFAKDPEASPCGEEFGETALHLGTPENRRSRRKALLNSLRDEGFEGAPTAAALEQAGIDPRRRAETLSIEEFAALTDALLSLS